MANGGVINPGKGRPCAICTHQKNTEIDTLIKQRLVAGHVIDYRNISETYGMAISAVSRHVSDHLKLKLREAIEDHQLKRVVDVYDEFLEQLDFAKHLRQSAQEYLSDVNDPLKLSITPKAHEIEVTYFDHNDMEIVPMGNKVIERPKKKAAQLSVILESFVDRNLHPEKFKVTTIDIRKFALEALDRADMSIDKFAKLGGNYTNPKTNSEDISAIAKQLVKELMATHGKSEEDAVAFAAKRYGVLESELLTKR